MPDEKDPSSPFQAFHDARLAAIAKHTAVLNSDDYVAASKFTRRMCLDFVTAVSTTSLYSTRAREIYDKMLLIRAADDAIQSRLAMLSLINDGMLNPAHRELRYLLERTVKLTRFGGRVRGL